MIRMYGKQNAAASALSIVDLVNHQRERRHSGPHYDRVGFRAWNSLQRDWSFAGADGRLQQWLTQSRPFARRHIAACLSVNSRCDCSDGPDRCCGYCGVTMTEQK